MDSIFKNRAIRSNLSCLLLNYYQDCLFEIYVVKKSVIHLGIQIKDEKKQRYKINKNKFILKYVFRFVVVSKKFT